MRRSWRRLTEDDKGRLAVDFQLVVDGENGTEKAAVFVYAK